MILTNTRALFLSVSAHYFAYGVLIYSKVVVNCEIERKTDNLRKVLL